MNLLTKLNKLPEVYSEPSKTSKMVFFAKLVNTLELLKFLQNSPSNMFQRVLKTPLTLNENCSYFEFFWSVFSCIQIEYGELLCKSQNAFHIRGNTHHKNSKYGYADIDVKSLSM